MISETEEGAVTEGARTDTPMTAILEALLYASLEPVTIESIVDAFGADRAGEIQSALDELMARYAAAGRGLMIEKVAGGYRIATRPEMAEVLREFVRSRNRSRLSRAALETLSVIAYRQPVTAPEIEAIRGVNPSGILRTLLERRLVKIVGRKKVVGKPFLYGTTPEFLLHFGLNTLDDLPAMEEFTDLLDVAPPAAGDPALPAAGEIPSAAFASEEDRTEGARRGTRAGFGADAEEE
ncbi:MAG TPA: SMC-Scp complex subunit ScpB [Verrucomicrobiae bacterium]|nr:SMC-Scp complex subunit ScpB [Verrucomicrobiae bacterium]